MSDHPKLPQPHAPPKTPLWVKVFIIILLVLAMIVVIAHLTGFRVNHGAGEILRSLVNLVGPIVSQL